MVLQIFNFSIIKKIDGISVSGNILVTSFLLRKKLTNLISKDI